MHRREAKKVQVTRFLDAWFAVRQFIQAANFNRFQGAGLSATQFMTLNLLPSNGDGLAIGELARRMNLKPATVAKTVDSLEARNLVTRVRSAPDRRVVLIHVTGDGSALQNAASGHFHAQIESIFQAMRSEERDGLVLGLESLARAAAQKETVVVEGGGSGRESSGLLAEAKARASGRPRTVPPAKRSARRSRPV